MMPGVLGHTLAHRTFVPPWHDRRVLDTRRTHACLHKMETRKERTHQVRITQVARKNSSKKKRERFVIDLLLKRCGVMFATTATAFLLLCVVYNFGIDFSYRYYVFS